jgi:hypothetical protein
MTRKLAPTVRRSCWSGGDEVVVYQIAEELNVRVSDRGEQGTEMKFEWPPGEANAALPVVALANRPQAG